VSRVVTRKSDQAQIWVIGAARERTRQLVLWLPQDDMLPGARFRDDAVINATDAGEFAAAHLERRKLPCGHTRSSTALTTTCYKCHNNRRLRTPSCRGRIVRHRWEPLPDAAADGPTHQCAWCGLVCRLGPQKRMLWYVDKATGEHRSPFERTKEKTP